MIELLAVIVILAVVALIAAPIVLDIIEDSKNSSNKISVENYAKAIENSLMIHQLENGSGNVVGKFTTEDGKTLIGDTTLIVHYVGDVVCDTIEIYDDGKIYLAGCAVNGTLIDYTYGIKQELEQDLEKEEDKVEDKEEEEESTPGTLLATIKKLYLNAEKNVVTDGDASYYYAESVLLMNDGLDTEGNVTNDETKGNIRYYGYRPNNFIYFNCDDYSDTTTCEIWRIIGIIDGKVKIMKDKPLGSFSWDYNYNDNQILGAGYETDWNTSSLNKLLNEAYYNNLNTEYYNFTDGSNLPERLPDDDPFGDDLDGDIESSEDTSGEYPEYVSYESSFNDRGTGITEATRVNNLISDSTWHINKVSYEPYLSSAFTVYQQEQQGTMIWTGKIGLTDLSDVIFSQSYDYGSWLLSNEDGWTLTSQDDSYVYSIGETGMLSLEPIGVTYFGAPGVYPTLYLSPELIVDQETDGSESNPYKLVIK